MSPVYLLLCFTITSVYGRVAVTDVSKADLNKIHGESKIDPISIEDDDDVTNNRVVKKLCLAYEDNIIVRIKPCGVTNKIDNGTALILTPLIEQGRLEEARNACRVDRSLFLDIDSYSGFLTVNSTYKSHLYFWYFPSFAKPINETPWIIWLQGGPGVSSLVGLFEEIGPFSANDGKLKLNPHTWLMNHSLVFIDNPVGAGYSFTEHEDGYARDMATYGKHLHIALEQLVQLFPELRVAPLYVAGESYAGKYVPALGMEIHRHKNTPGTDINFKGLIVGNGFVEPEMITQLTRTLYNFGMLDLEQLEAVQPLVDVFLADVAANRSIEAGKKYSQLLGLVQSISQTQPINFLSDYKPNGKFVAFLLKPEIKRALHVGDRIFSFANVTVSGLLALDYLSSSKHLFEELLNTYRVLLYCGHLDQMLPCTTTSERLRLWKWSESNEFMESWRYPFFIDEKLAGYYKTGGNLTWAVVRGAGHMVPIDQPVSSQLLISNWTHSLPLNGQISFEGEDKNISPMEELRTVVQKMITDTTNQTSNSTSDANNQTSSGTTDVISQTEESIVIQINLSNENSIIVKTNQTSARSVSVNVNTTQTGGKSFILNINVPN